jgi:hypothetical protein
VHVDRAPLRFARQLMRAVEAVEKVKVKSATRKTTSTFDV